MSKTKLQESDIENIFVEFLQGQGYEHFFGPEIAPYTEDAQREGFDSVILEKHFKESLKRLNPEVPESARIEAYQKVLNLGGADVMDNNEIFHKMLTEGITVEYFQSSSKQFEQKENFQPSPLTPLPKVEGDNVASNNPHPNPLTEEEGNFEGGMKSEIVKLIDIKNPKNNFFWVVNQFEIKENGNHKIPDVVIFVNGLPLVLVELKSATSENATLENAYTQIQNYKKAIPSIFYYNALTVISDGLDARVSSLSAPFSRYLAWKGPKERQGELIPEMQMMAEEMLRKDVLLKLIRYNTVFETEEVKDEETGIIKQVKIKKVAAYHQFYAVEKAVKETLRAIALQPSPLTPLPEGEEDYGNRKIGVVWHTQGSGKSLSMVFYVGQLITHPEMKNPTLVILTDRNDLDDQLFGTFGNCQSLLRQKPVQAENRRHLKELLKVSGGGIIFTTIQKFYPEDGAGEFETLTERKNVVVIADEAHRSQYGFKARVVETENGVETRYGNAKYLRDALPNASFIGFTGTPIEKEDKSTLAVFGDYIDVYDIAQAVKDGATVPISYESRLVKVNLDQKTGDEIDRAIDEISNALPEQIQKAKKRVAQIESIVGAPERLADVAKDIVEHFEKRQEVFVGKGIIVAMTRKIAVDLYEQIIKLRPEWHSNDLQKGKIKVVMTSSSDDPESFQPHHTTKQQRKDLALRLKDVSDELDLVIVQSMWLTGFDAPILHTMYIDKKMQGANLMQAIARVNRVYKDKPGGLIVDYIGIGQELKNAMATYTESGGKGKAVADIKEVIAGMKEKFEIVEGILHPFDWRKYFDEDAKGKLQVLLEASNYILGDEDLKKRFISEVEKLSKLFAMAVPSFEAEEIKEEVAFFQAVKSRISKFTVEGGKTDRQVQTAVRQIVDEALSSDGVVDIFEAAGVKTPSLDILSDEFLLEMKNMKQKNLAFELLKKLLSDDVKVRKTKNITQAKKFSEMLATVIKKYHNNQIDTAQVIEELSEIAREMKMEDKKAEELGLTEAEYAFYTVLRDNDSTSFLEDDVMKELIHLITETVRKNATVDWEKREDVRAKLRLTVRKLLIRYGYPPDLARIEADKVLEQSEVLAEEFVQKA